MLGQIYWVHRGWPLAALPLATLLTCCCVLRADTIPVLDSGQGWIESDNINNGNTQTTNYAVGVIGNCCSTVLRDHFDFPIPDFTGALTSATLNLFEPIGNASAGGELYSLYSLGSFGSYAYSDIGTGALYASTTVTAADDEMTIQIPLDSAALLAMIAHQGATFSLGGRIADETTADDFLFGGSTDFVASLTLTTIATPEPSIRILSAIGLAVCVLRRRKLG